MVDVTVVVVVVVIVLVVVLVVMSAFNFITLPLIGQPSNVRMSYNCVWSYGLL